MFHCLRHGQISPRKVKMIFSLIFSVILFFALGASIASFLCVVAERGKKNETIMGKSHCICGRELKASENIPVIGYLKTRGVAKCCGSKLPRRYLYAELSLGIVFAISFTAALVTFSGGMLFVALAISIVASGIILTILKSLK